jgi:hypothetical protein
MGVLGRQSYRVLAVPSPGLDEHREEQPAGHYVPEAGFLRIAAVKANRGSY